MCHCTKIICTCNITSSSNLLYDENINSHTRNLQYMYKALANNIAYRFSQAYLSNTINLHKNDDESRNYQSKDSHYIYQSVDLN